MEGAAREVQVSGSGLLVRHHRGRLEALGLLAPVCARVSPGVARLLLEPPLPMVWVPDTWFSEVLLALEDVAGREACRQLGAHAARASAGGVLAPVVRTTATLFGATPPTFYTRLGTFASVMVRNVAFSFAPTGPRAGTLTVRYATPEPDVLYASWEGVCTFLHELCGETGTVARTRLEEEGRVGYIDVEW